MSEIYIGPNLPIVGLVQNTTFKTLPVFVQELVLLSADVRLLVVPIDAAALKLAAVVTKGTPEYEAYSRLSNGKVRDAVQQPPSANDAPGVGPIDVTLQDAVTAAGAGTAYKPSRGNETLTFAITGTSTIRTVIFELADPSGVYVPCTAFNIMDPTKFGTQTTGGNNTLPESWLVDVPIGYSFRARVSAVSGGNVTIKGKAVL